MANNTTTFFLSCDFRLNHVMKFNSVKMADNVNPEIADPPNINKCVGSPVESRYGGGGGVTFFYNEYLRSGARYPRTLQGISLLAPAAAKAQTKSFRHGGAMTAKNLYFIPLHSPVCWSHPAIPRHRLPTVEPLSAEAALCNMGMNVITLPSCGRHFF